MGEIQRRDVARLCEINRQLTNLTSEKELLTMMLRDSMKREGITEWADEYFKLSFIKEKNGRERVDIEAMKAAGLQHFITVDPPREYVKARRL